MSIKIRPPASVYKHTQSAFIFLLNILILFKKDMCNVYKLKHNLWKIVFFISEHSNFKLENKVNPSTNSFYKIMSKRYQLLVYYMVFVNIRPITDHMVYMIVAVASMRKGRQSLRIKNLSWIILIVNFDEREEK